MRQTWSSLRLGAAQRRHAGFTLIELLVAIAIIGVLLAILVPVLGRTRRAALVLRCPIVYVAADKTVWITDPRGRWHLRMGQDRCASFFGPRWSPAGNLLGWGAPAGRVVVVDPKSDRTTRLQTDRIACVLDWRDNRTVIGREGADLTAVDVLTGEASTWKTGQEREFPADCDLYSDPVLLGGHLTCDGETLWAPKMDVYLRDTTFKRIKTIWEDPGNDFEDRNAKPDWTCDRVAWSRVRAANSGDSPRFVAIKSLAAPSSSPPVLIGGQFQSALFCDWTPDGDLLVIVEEGGELHLVTMDTTGMVVRTIPTPHGLGRGGNVDPFLASWRRPRHF